MEKIILSKNKIQLEHKIPIHIKGFDSPITFIDIKARYKKDKLSNYSLIRSSIDSYLETLSFKWKIGTYTQSGSKYKINGITPHFLPQKIGNDSFMVVQFILVDDTTFLSKMRGKKLNDLLNEVI